MSIVPVYGQGTVSAAGALKKCNYTHDAVIDALIANPSITQNDLAAIFGYSVPWMSRVMCSDAFQVRLAARKEEILDPLLREEIENGFRALVNKSLNVLLERLSQPAPSEKTALQALEIGARALAYGARAPQVQVNVQNVAVVPAKAASSADWVREFRPQTVPPLESLDSEP